MLISFVSHGFIPASLQVKSAISRCQVTWQFINLSVANFYNSQTMFHRNFPTINEQN